MQKALRKLPKLGRVFLGVFICTIIAAICGAIAHYFDYDRVARTCLCTALISWGQFVVWGVVYNIKHVGFAVVGAIRSNPGKTITKQSHPLGYWSGLGTILLVGIAATLAGCYWLMRG